VPSVGFPPRTLFTFQSTFVVGAPVTVAVNVFVFALPAATVADLGEIATVGGATIVVTAVTDNCGSS